MRVRAIEPIILRYPEPNDFDHIRHTLLIRLETEDGIEGWGEAVAMWPEACAAAAALIRDGFGAVVTGMDVREPAALWRALKRHSWWYGEGGIATLALSGIDMAVWDACGKVMGQPLWRLLGGRAHETLPAIASLHVNRATIEEGVAEIGGHIAGGFRGTKLGFGKRGLSTLGQDPDGVVALVEALRAAVGPSAMLMVDIGNGVRWDAATAIVAARRLEAFAVDWIEEPLHPDDLDGLERLQRASAIRIATGERLWTVAGYDQLIRRRIVDVFGIDPARAEGVTGFCKIAALVEAAGANLNAHAWSTALTTAASLHLSLASPAARVFELKPRANPMQHELPETPIWHEDGLVAAPDGPGLGVVPRPACIERYRIRA